MPKAVISNKIYMEVTPELRESIQQQLTYKIIPDGGNAIKVRGRVITKIETIKHYEIVNKKVIAIPQGRVDLIPEGYEIIDKRIDELIPFPNTNFDLNEAQVPVYNEVNGSCLINALPGWGKTFTALHIAKKLGQKTLIITHTVALRDQWANEIEKMFGHRPGVIGSGVEDVEDHFIVVSNVQTLIKVYEKYTKEFGTVVVDECLDYESLIRTKEYGLVKIGVLVNNEKPCHVLALDPLTGTTGYKKVLRYFKNQATPAIKITHSGGGSIKCTTNHSVYIYVDGALEKIPAEYVEVGDYLVQDTVSHKATHILNKEWNPILLGILLGDGSLGYPHGSSSSVRLRFTHGQGQIDYYNWKRELLKSTNPTEVVGKSGYCNNTIKTCSTKSFVDYEGWRTAIYSSERTGNKTKVPLGISEQLTKESWAIIYQDDGSGSQDNALTFSFCEFDLTSCENLSTSLKKIFRVENPKIFTCSKGFNYIRLNKQDSLLFKREIAHLIHPSMYYKLKGIDTSNIKFSFIGPDNAVFNEHFAVRKVSKIEPTTLTGGYRYNIEVEDVHTYFANGLLVANCHHTPATTFTKALTAFYAKYRIGLSGTLKRKDGKHVLFTDLFGHDVFKPPKSNTIDPIVYITRTGLMLTPNLPWVNKINDLLYNEDYQMFIANLAINQMNQGHRVLITADRVEFLVNVANFINTAKSESCVLITGSTETKSQTIRESLLKQVEDGEKMCVAASRQIFTEGLSLNILSCVILAVPTGNHIILEQLIGRIMRKHPIKDNLQPKVIDLTFSGFESKKQNESRLAFYLEKGWETVIV